MDEALRQIDADILKEPIPEKLRQILRGAQDAPEQQACDQGCYPR